MHLVASVRPSVCFGAKKGHYQYKEFVCVSVIRGAYADNLADAVDRLLISHMVGSSQCKECVSLPCNSA